ncbi:oxidoreductase [Rhodococcus sp. 06-418-1B]|nr:PDR/VanB family oxidoreductase [Rhodococcus sp. 06-418-1B]OZC92979.1 oxidoreductase [Rhodococcus sp. 06-418-1B]
MTTSSIAENVDEQHRATILDLEVEIVRIAEEAAGIRSLELATLNGVPMPKWQPGAHIDLILSSDLERQYSLCGDPTDHSTWRVAVLREPESRGGSQWVHDQLNVGDKILVRGPRNNFPLEEAENYLFIAGGIGITPILPMISRCETDGVAWKLVYGGRSLSSMAFVDLLRQYGEDKVTLWPQDEHGIIDLQSLLGQPRTDTAVYCCGPGVLLDAVEDRCATWPKGSLHLERFRPKAGALDGVNTAFEVELDETGIVLNVRADQSIVDALDAAGIQVATSCREGTCGTCETVVFEGTPDHRDSFLTAQEKESNEVMMICCSRAKCDRLVLDL